jgi:hypothetical protein
MASQGSFAEIMPLVDRAQENKADARVTMFADNLNK